ncbi:MAG: hypothetical protein ISR44_01460 [Rhodospirillales bacterium]|nr:hypothetical protein [Rhodospirillales bacterium]
MIDITVSDDFANAGIRVTLGCIQCAVGVTTDNAELHAELDAEEARRLESLDGRPVSEVPQIAAARKAYRAFGKDPARYRVSSEALMRRLVKSRGIYRINSVVDTNNLISLRCGHSIGAFSAELLEPPVIFRKAKPGETYDAIGRGPMNIEFLPVFADGRGPFGSPTSDSERTKITVSTRTLLMAIIAFGEERDLAATVAWAAERLQTYCAATDMQTALIGNGHE